MLKMLLKNRFCIDQSVFYTFMLSTRLKNITQIIRFFMRFSCVFVQLLQTLLKISTHIKCGTE